MAKISILDNQTIDKIAAGEVVERPASVVKELVENAIDAGADAVTVEIKDGGTSLIRVTDNGGGIEKSQVGNAFLRHATSKISSADDLTRLVSLGFRGEALASIAAVAQVELITKTPEELTGIRYVIEGGVEKAREEIGAPGGTTLLVRNLFYNTPPRKKFLKQPRTEGSYVADLMEHLAMSNPEVSFKFLLNGQTKFYTTGSGDLREIVYRIYGKDIADALTDFRFGQEGMTVTGLLGKPVINRANRSYEIFYINGRYIRSTLISKAVEEGYREYLMQHKFPFCILHFQIDTEKIDVNVHPSKMEVRIADAPVFHETVREAVEEALREREMIPEVTLSDPGKKEPKDAEKRGRRAGETAPEPFEKRRIARNLERQATGDGAEIRISGVAGEPEQAAAIRAIYEKSRPAEANVLRQTTAYLADGRMNMADRKDTGGPKDAEGSTASASQNAPLQAKAGIPAHRPQTGMTAGKPEQMTMFDDKILSAEAKEQYEIIGQLFETYWLLSYQDKLLIIDQHAAHEKVRYERLMRHFREKEVVSQNINPPMIVTLNNQERECLKSHAEDFAALGFIIEEFGGNDYAVRGVPLDLYGYAEGAFFYEILDELAAEAVTGTPESVRSRIATMACKAAVKGNMRMSRQEMEALIDELLTLDNPYNCPHGRPTIISMSRQELEKKFKRIV
ncbi:MAG: DNA mismatch repair endonuclease MutL [Lachnospiraceae bacterium]|nr:DNA mismatch repair endonuclease MutL [Lachnospiraceae bacterium]